MSEKLSNADLKEYAGWSKYDGDVSHEIINAMATELLDLRADAETSQNHNAGVIDRIVEQLRDAGYTGTLSEMVDQACDAKQFCENFSM